MAISKDFCYRPHGRVVIKYLAGRTYERVPEAAVSEILKAEAGMIKSLEKHNA